MIRVTKGPQEDYDDDLETTSSDGSEMHRARVVGETDRDNTVEEKELLYFVGGDGGVRVFERGEGG